MGSAERERGPTISRGRFAKISEVEGIVLNKRMTARCNVEGYNREL
jgi:hypothetical protein